MGEEWDRSKFLENIISSFKKTAESKLKELPSLDDLPFMEPHLRQLYSETYFVTMLGLNTTSLVMQGVLLEAILKEIIYINEKKEFKREFRPAIERCESKNYLEKEDIDFLDNFRLKVRNIYQHSDMEELTKEIKFPTQVIEYKTSDELKEKLEKVKKEGMKPNRLMGYKDLRPIGVVAKGVIEKREIMSVFQSVDEFVRRIAKRYFKS